MTDNERAEFETILRNMIASPRDEFELAASQSCLAAVRQLKTTKALKKGAPMKLTKGAARILPDMTTVELVGAFVQAFRKEILDGSIKAEVERNLRKANRGQDGAEREEWVKAYIMYELVEEIATKGKFPTPGPAPADYAYNTKNVLEAIAQTIGEPESVSTHFGGRDGEQRPKPDIGVRDIDSGLSSANAANPVKLARTVKPATNAPDHVTGASRMRGSKEALDKATARLIEQCGGKK